MNQIDYFWVQVLVNLSADFKKKVINFAPSGKQGKVVLKQKFKITPNNYNTDFWVLFLLKINVKCHSPRPPPHKEKN